MVYSLKRDEARLSFELPSTVVAAWGNTDIGTKLTMDAKLTRSNLAAIYAYNGPLTSDEILGFFSTLRYKKHIR